jgi:large subunit ribosomal protein L17
LGIRPGDNAEKAMIELVDFNEIYGNSVNAAAEPAKKIRRSRATTKKADVAEAEVVAETPVAETAVEPTADSSTDKAAE